jgi:hypothetical protein
MQKRVGRGSGPFGFGFQAFNFIKNYEFQVLNPLRSKNPFNA